MPTTVIRPTTSRYTHLRVQRFRAIGLVLMMIFASLAAIEFGAWKVAASTDQDGDGLTLGMEFLLNTQPQDWDSDNDGLPDGWEWKYGLDPLDNSALGNNGAAGDPDGDGLSNLQEYRYLMPNNWDLSSTPNVLDNGVWWNGTVPVRNWNEEGALGSASPPACGDPGNDGQGSTILCDEDPMGNMCDDGIDNDRDGLVDAADPDGDGDADCSSDDDDGDGLIDEDPDGWDTDNDGMPDGWEVANGLNATNPNNADGMYGDPDNDGLINIYEYINPSWTTSPGGIDVFQPGPVGGTATEPCNPIIGVGPGGGLTCTAEVDGVTQTNPQVADTDGDGLNDSYEALILLTDPTSSDTDSDGIDDGVEVYGAYGFPAQASDPRDNNTDDDQLDDGDEDKNGNGVVDSNETDPTRREDAGDFDNDGIENWEENLSCTMWNIADTDYGGVHDGDELNFSHGTDPCMSVVDFITSVISYNAGQQRLYLDNTSGFNPAGGAGFYNDSNGQLTGFGFQSVAAAYLIGVSVAPPVNTQFVIAKNGSWCHYSAVQSGQLSSTMNFCDDDYEDTDGDGLADWEELMGTYGFTSLPTQYDSDGDGVNDWDEVMNGTNPMEPCDNNKDTDSDLLNDYFENNTGCPIDYIPGIIGNGTTDTYVTDYLNPDTDAGGVWDGQEYLDGTNPEDNPGDDQNPIDTDGDGIPDSVENNTGTDWRDPDTDGGGMLDGEECPPPMWIFNCIGGQYNPWDPSDDVIENAIIFWANNSTFGVDPNLPHYWRVHTYDSYTGASYGKNATYQIWVPMSTPFLDEGWIANPTFRNSSEVWTMQFTTPVSNTNIPHHYAATEYTMWIDGMASLNHSNITHDVRVSDSGVDLLLTQAPEILFDTTALDNSIAYSSASNYAMEYPVEFTDPIHPYSQVGDITNTVISGAVSAWDKAVAIQDFLQNGNSTTTFLLNFDGSALPMAEDVTNHVLTAAFEGSCSEFASVYTTMARIAGLPARKVTGYAAGAWHGTGFTVTGAEMTAWSEVHLQQNAAGNNFDMGWIPINPCPAAQTVEVVNETWTPLTIDRDHSTGDIWLNGTLLFVDNGSAASNIIVHSYLITAQEAATAPAQAATGMRRLGTSTTDVNGSFSVKGIPGDAISPGYGSIVLEHVQQGYVPYGVEVFGWTINVTDDVVITQDTPSIPGQPIVGAGTTTTITGYMSWENIPLNDPSTQGNLTLFMNYTSAIDGVISLQTIVGEQGYYEFDVSLDENEGLGFLNAAIDFPGWHQAGLHLSIPPVYHARPETLNIQFNVSAAPNLTADLHGPGQNNSLLEVGEDLFINGTVLSRGLNPVPMNGTLYLQMRQNGSTGPFDNITFWVMDASNVNQVTGEFNIVWNASAMALSMIGPGYIDVELLFIPDDLDASDVANLSTGYGLQSVVTITIVLWPVLRGSLTTVFVQLMDHTDGQTVDFNGTYVTEFDGTLINTSADPVGGAYMLEWTPPSTIAAADYTWYTNYTSTTQWYKNASMNTLQRIQGLVTVSVVLGSDWTHIGGTNNVSGELRDDVFNNLVLGNDTDLSIQLELPGVGPPDPMGNPPPPIMIPLGVVALNTTTGAYFLSFTMPTNMPGGAYDLTVMADFNANPPVGGPYYIFEQPGQTIVGSESEAMLQLNQTNVLVEAGQQLQLEVDVKDIAAYFSVPPVGQEDAQNISGASVEFFWDVNGANTSLGTGISNSNGRVTFTWNVPINTDPAYYDVYVVMYDDVTDAVTTNNAARWLGNDTLANVTVQVPTIIDINSSVPTVVTAGTSFQLVGRVQDSINSVRPFSGPIGIEVFWLDDIDEKLISSYTTSVDGEFNVSVPTDPFGDGLTSGNHTLVVSVLNGTNPFYLSATGTHSMLVMGVTDFEALFPSSGIVVNRGDSVEFWGNLVEVSDNFRAINSTVVDARFHDTWIGTTITDVNGTALWNYTVPYDQPLGPITVTLYFNGSWHLLSDASPINTITVASVTVLVVDNITENPVAGDSFNVTGTLVSDNGTGIIYRDGSPMLPGLGFNIDGYTDTFNVQNGTAQSDGTFWALITLDANFPRGSHNLTVVFTPSVNYYGSSSGVNTFDSRGFSVLRIISPANLNVDDRVVRGSVLNVTITLHDNAGDPIANASIVLNAPGMSAAGLITTDANGYGAVNLTVSNMTLPGPHYLFASFAGIAGTTGVLGDDANAGVVILAPTVLSIDSIEGTLIAGQTLIINGTLLDEHGMYLLGSDGNASGGIIHLLVDGQDIGSTWAVMTDPTFGTFSITYTLPQGITAGAHSVGIEFLGGYLWVDPIGSGDSANPEYYLSSNAQDVFNCTQPTHINIIDGGGDVDRETLISMSSVLLDLVDRPVANQTIEIYLDGVFLTNVTTNADGEFSAFYPVPSDMTLGPVIMDVMFTGAEFHLPSSNQLAYTVYSPVNISIDLIQPAAIGDTILITGTVRDNLPAGWIFNHTVEIRIDDILYGTATTDANGLWTFEWDVPISLDLGGHEIEVYAPAQGYYREGVANASFWIAHHSEISLNAADNGDATRGMFWTISGRLYDSDEVGLPGIAGAQVHIALDGAGIDTITTDSEGRFTLIIPVSMNSARGAHTITARYDGDNSWLGSEEDEDVTTWADILIEISYLSDNIIRSDSTHQLRIEGRIVEVGGSGNPLMGSELVLTYRNQEILLMGGALFWDNQTNGFVIEFTPDVWVEPGDAEFLLTVLQDDARHLNSNNETIDAFIRVQAEYEIIINEVVWQGRNVSGTVTVRDIHSSQAIANLSMTAYLRNSSEVDPLNLSFTRDTDAAGVFTFEFNSFEPMPPFSDQSFWGEMHIRFDSSAPELAEDSRATLTLEVYSLTYEEPASASKSAPYWIWGIVVLIIAGAAVGIWILMNRRKQAIDELAEIFAYTAELLAAGDEIREAIFHCYEELCAMLMTQGHLRRDFETVREFEVAIRKAMPISEEALGALDNMFEIARYSRHELGQAHKEQAQSALARTIQEITAITQQPAMGQAMSQEINITIQQ